MEEDDMIFNEEEMLDESPKVGGKYISISELESYTIKCLLTSQILLSRYIDLLKSSYFENASNKVLFKLIKNYYKDMGHKIPKDEVALRLEAMLPTKPGTEDKQKELRDNCKATVERVFSEEEVDQESANLNLKDFVFKRSAEESLDELINSVTGSDPSNYEQNQYYAIEKCIVRLSESVNIAVDASEPFTLSDIKKIPEIKKEGLGEGTRIVKFFLDSLNDTMEYGGINVGAVACVMAPPGCFTGDTRIMTLDGKTETLENLYNQKSKNLECYSFNKEDRKIQIKTADSVYLSKYENDLAEIEIDGKYKIKCTLDHPFLLRGEKSYTQAKDLKVGDSLEPIYRTIGEEAFPNRIAKKEYEVVIDGDNKKEYTANLSCLEKYNRLPKKKLEQIHHKDHNKLNNRLDNIEIENKVEHLRYHALINMNRGEESTGYETRFGQPNGNLNHEQIISHNKSKKMREINSKKSKERWQIKEFRNKMKNNMDSLISKNFDKKEQEYRRKCKMLSSLNSLINLYGIDNITVDNYHQLVKDSKLKYNARLPRIAKLYNVNTFKEASHSRRILNGKKDLEMVWSKILEDAKRYNHKVTNIKFIHLDEAVPVYGLVEVGQNHNYAIALNNEEGIFVSNTGKTTFLTNQGLFSAQQGLNVCHIFLGDMEKYDALIRYYSVFTEARYRKIEILNRNIEKRISAYKMLLKRYKKEDKQYKYYEKKIQEDEAVLHQNRLMDEKYKANKNMFSSKQLVSMSDEELELIYGRDEEYLKIANNIDVNVYAVGEMSMDALRQAIYNWQNQRKKHYDVIIIDYDSNLKQPADNMYESGGIIYDQAKNMAQVNKSVVFMASQPNKAYWKNEMIPLEACSESSKKQMIIDLLITVGRPEGVNTGIRKVFIPKNRRGKENEILHAKMNGETGFMYEISQEDYTTLKKQGYDPTLIISAGGMYGKKKKEESTEEQPVTNAALPETMKQVSL